METKDKTFSKKIFTKPMLTAVASVLRKSIYQIKRVTEKIKLFVREKTNLNLFEKNSKMPVKGKSYSEKLQLLKQLIGEYDLSDEKEKELFKSKMFEVIKELKDHEIQIPIRYCDNRITVMEIKKRPDRIINLSDI